MPSSALKRNGIQDHKYTESGGVDYLCQMPNTSLWSDKPFYMPIKPLKRIANTVTLKGLKWQKPSTSMLSFWSFSNELWTRLKWVMIQSIAWMLQLRYDYRYKTCLCPHSSVTDCKIKNIPNCWEPQTS